MSDQEDDYFDDDDVSSAEEAEPKPDEDSAEEEEPFGNGDEAGAKPVEWCYIIPKGKRTFTNFIDRLEETEIISIRSSQIEATGVAFIDKGTMTDPRDIARAELDQRKCPLIIRRFAGYRDGQECVEEWFPNEMARLPQ